MYILDIVHINVYIGYLLLLILLSQFDIKISLIFKCLICFSLYMKLIYESRILSTFRIRGWDFVYCVFVRWDFVLLPQSKRQKGVTGIREKENKKNHTVFITPL